MLMLDLLDGKLLYFYFFIFQDHYMELLYFYIVWNGNFEFDILKCKFIEYLHDNSLLKHYKKMLNLMGYQLFWLKGGWQLIFSNVNCDLVLVMDMVSIFKNR